VILMTAADPKPHMDRARNAGAAGFFQKSVDPSELARFVHQFLDEAAVAES
jgi:DNA-binding NarL/FixJ family response regulator